MSRTQHTRPASRQRPGRRPVGDACLAELRARLAWRCDAEPASEGDDGLGSVLTPGSAPAPGSVAESAPGSVAESAAGGTAKSAISSAGGAGGIRDGVGAVVGPLLRGPLVAGETARAADDADLVWCAQAVQRAINALEGARSTLAAEATRRRLHARRGEASGAETLVNATAVGGAAARRIEREAEALTAQPQVAEALGRGEINAEQAAVVATADVPDEVRSELCAQAGSQTADQTRQAVRAAETAARVETDTQRRARQRAARSASMWTDPHDGMWHLRAKLDPLTGDDLNRRLLRTIQQHWRTDKHLPESQRRSVPQRAADALAALITAGGAHSTEPAGPSATATGAQGARPTGQDAGTTASARHAESAPRDQHPQIQLDRGGDADARHAESAPRDAAAPDATEPGSGAAGGAAALSEPSGGDGWVVPNPSQMIVITTLDNLRNSSPHSARRADKHHHDRHGADGRDAGGCGVSGHHAGCSHAAAQPTSGLLAVPDAAAITETGTSLSAADLRRLACDTRVIPVVMGGAGEVLDVGRATRTIPPAIRRALIARDQRCVWPGCNRAPIHCDGHHIDHWVDDGPTCVANLALLCHTHHQRLHEYNFDLHPPNGPAAPGEGWTVTPALPRQHRTPTTEHIRQNC